MVFDWGMELDIMTGFYPGIRAAGLELFMIKIWYAGCGMDDMMCRCIWLLQKNDCGSVGRAYGKHVLWSEKISLEKAWGSLFHQAFFTTEKDNSDSEKCFGGEIFQKIEGFLQEIFDYFCKLRYDITYIGFLDLW